MSSNDSGNYTCLVTNASGENGNKTVEVVVEGGRFLYEKLCLISVSLDECACMIGHIKSNNTTTCLPINHKVSDPNEPLKFSMLTANFEEDKFGW